MSYKSIKSCGVKGIGRVETVIRDAFTENSAGKNITLDGKIYKVKSIYTSVISNTIELNIIDEEWYKNHLKTKNKWKN